MVRQSRRASGHAVLLGWLLVLCAATPVAAQLGRPPGFRAVEVQWWQAAAGAAALAAVLLVDPGVDDLMRTGHSGAGDAAVEVLRPMGEPLVFGAAVLGTVAAGLVTGDARVTAAGMRIGAAVGVAGLATHGLKQLFGRERPLAGDADDFRLMGSGRSLPSGHTTVAFALAASAADEIQRPVATVVLYGLAAGTAVSRIYDRKHWLSDVALGAAVGVASAKFLNGRWSLFGLRAPRFLVGAGGIGITTPLPH